MTGDPEGDEDGDGVAASIGLAEGNAITEGGEDEDTVGALVGLTDGN